MEMEYPVLRPKRKLCYITDNESPAKHWEGTLTLQDIDKIFDDMDSASQANLQPPSPLLQTSDSEIHQNKSEDSVPPERQLIKKPPGHQLVTGDDGDVLHPASTELDIDLDIPFKGHHPVKTSSPAEQSLAAEEEKQDDEKSQVVSPILFMCEYEGIEEVKKDSLPTQNPQCNGQVTEENSESGLESPPSKIDLTKISGHKKEIELQGSQESIQPAVQTVSRKPEVAAPVASTRAGKDMTAFLQKLKHAAQSKPFSSGKKQVKVPTPPPEPEDDFMILEDDTPLWFSIPSKSAASKKQNHSRIPSTDKDSSDKRTKDRSLEMPEPQQETEKSKSKLEDQPVDQKIKKKTKKEKNSEETGPRNEENKLPAPQDAPAGDLLVQEEPVKKKKQLKKTLSKESDEAEDQPEDTTSRKTEKAKPSKKTERKASKSAETKKQKSSKDGKENTKTQKADSLKASRKELQGEPTVKDVDEQTSDKHRDTEDIVSTVDKEAMNCETDGQVKQNNQPVVSKGTSSEDCQVLGKRKRKSTGEWWLSCPQSTEEADNSQQATQKKSKQKPKDSSEAVPSPAKAKKDKASKKRNQKQLKVLPNQETSEFKKRKTKQSEKGNKQGEKLDKMKAIDKDLVTAEPEHADGPEQQEVPDQELDQESSPLVFTQRDHSLNSGNEIFQKVYQHDSTGKLSATPKAPVSQSRPKERLTEADSAKRRRRAPGEWWLANNVAEDLENMSSKPQQLHPKRPKPKKERKKQSKQSKSPRLGVPKNGNTAVSLKPLGGAPVPPLTAKSLITPKTVKRSMATFKDLFASVIESSTVDRRQTNRCNVRSRPSEEICVAGSNTHAADNSPDNQETTRDSRSQVHRSGPSSMIELEDYEDADSIILPSSRSTVLLSASDLCAPPLKPLILQRKDMANLAEWFRSLWLATPEGDPGVTPDQFDWYFYQDRAMGLQEDVSTSSFCSGKLLLGSLMKKPLWVDHSATTVFNLLTSSVGVTIDGCESCFSPGKSFVVESGKNIYIYCKISS
uniref:Titin-like n=1 Tax=Haplochromis burtoni TaxID=8153 RepID=A0A3Q3CUQ4_HAPBU